MSQDSDNSRGRGNSENRPVRRRDGEPRSNDRRDDDRPRFNQSRSNGPQSNRSDQPRFNRSDGPRSDGPRSDGPRSDGPRTGGPRDGAPRSSGPRDGGYGSRTPRDGGSESRNSGPRTNDRPRSNDTDRPRFNRTDREGGSGSRFGGSGSGARPDTDRPRFNKDNTGRNNNTDRPRFNRTERGTGSRPDRTGDSSRPRFGDSGRSDDRNRSEDRPRFNRSDGPRTDGPRDGGSAPRNDDRPRRTGTDRPDFNRDRTNSGRGDRDGGPRSSDDSRPRFDRSDRTNDSGQQSDRPRFNRDGATGSRDNSGANDRPRPFNRDSSGGRSTDGSRPRFSRDSSGRPKSDKPAFKRVGGFSREADERNNNSGFNNDRPTDVHREGESGSRDESRPERRTRNSDSPDNTRSSRFSSEQRKDSGERRTGFFTKAPNYELTQRREVRNERDGNAGARTRSDAPGRDRYSDSDKSKRGGAEPKARAEEPSEPGLTRLNRYIANSGVCSRREADELIARGDITVNGKVVTEMGYKVKENDTVKYGTKVLNPERFVYVLLNKPKDFITTTDDPAERKTVMELVADAGNFRMYPVGRLDRNTTGLLLITNDGELADKLTHPSNNIRKIYQVEIDKPITEEHFDAIRKGIELEDGPIKPDALSIVTPDAQVVGIELHSGRNRIVRRIFESLGYEVTKLDRTTYAGLTKKELPRGKWRFLDPKEVVKLKYFNS